CCRPRLLTGLEFRGVSPGRPERLAGSWWGAVVPWSEGRIRLCSRSRAPLAAHVIRRHHHVSEHIKAVALIAVIAVPDVDGSLAAHRHAVAIAEASNSLDSRCGKGDAGTQHAVAVLVDRAHSPGGKRGAFAGCAHRSGAAQAAGDK